jgi:hypothetical protein
MATAINVEVGGSMTTKTKVIIGLVAAVVVVGGGTALYFGMRKPKRYRGLGRTRRPRSLGCGCGA